MNLEEGIVARHLLVEIIGSASLNEKETMEKFFYKILPRSMAVKF